MVTKVKRAESWFDVDRNGLKQLVGGKPKTIIVRELVANSFDERVSQVRVQISWSNGEASICVGDDSPDGFKRLSDAFTLFRDTEKRANPAQRGRFCIGEKQLLALAEYGEVLTTTGAVVFAPDGRTIEPDRKTGAGSIVTLIVKMTKADADACAMVARRYIAPESVEYVVDGREVPRRRLFRSFTVDALPTVLLEEGSVRPTRRTATIELYDRWSEPGTTQQAWLYELGIPIQPIDGEYDVNVMQKVPLPLDRDCVSDAYLARVYAEVLNRVHDVLPSDVISEPWIRVGMSHPKVDSLAVKAVIQKRYGDKVVVAGPAEDPRSIDDAKSHGYQIVFGGQMSAGEWDNVRKAGAIPSAGSKFRHTVVAGEDLVPTPDMLKVMWLTRRIAKLCLGQNVLVKFMKWDGVAAQYGNNVVTFNVKALGEDWFADPLRPQVIDLVVHELAHEYGRHTEHAYLSAITRMAGELVQKALDEPRFFRRLDGDCVD